MTYIMNTATVKRQYNLLHIYLVKHETNSQREKLTFRWKQCVFTPWPRKFAVKLWLLFICIISPCFQN